MVSDKSRASGRVSGLYKSPYSRSLLEKKTARSEGKQRPTALSRCWNPLRGGSRNVTTTVRESAPTAYLLCTSLRRIRRFERICRLKESITQILGKPLV